MISEASAHVSWPVSKQGSMKERTVPRSKASQTKKRKRRDRSSEGHDENLFLLAGPSYGFLHFPILLSNDESSMYRPKHFLSPTSEYCTQAFRRQFRSKPQHHQTEPWNQNKGDIYLLYLKIMLPSNEEKLKKMQQNMYFLALYYFLSLFANFIQTKMHMTKNLLFSAIFVTNSAAVNTFILLQCQCYPPAGLYLAQTKVSLI